MSTDGEVHKPWSKEEGINLLSQILKARTQEYLLPNTQVYKENGDVNCGHQIPLLAAHLRCIHNVPAPLLRFEFVFFQRGFHFESSPHTFETEIHTTRASRPDMY